MTEMRSLAIEDFRALIGTRFHVPFDNGARVTLVLNAVRPLRINPFPGRSRDPFALEFVGDGPYGMLAASYRMFNETLGWIDIHLSPQPIEAGPRLYGAVFN